MPENKVRYGLKNLHIAFANDLDANPPTWKDPVAVDGVVGFKPKTEGNDVKVYADDGLYFEMTTNDGYTADLEIQAIPDSVLAEALGWTTDTNGMVVEKSDGIQKAFAMMFQVAGDVRNKRFVYYNCKAARPQSEQKTKGDKVEPSTDTLSVTISPLEINGVNVVKGSLELSDTNAAAYNAFYSQVVLPDAVIGAVVKTSLAAVIAMAGKLDQADYTADSWTAFQAVLTSSSAVNSNGSATQYDVNNATKALQNAILALVAVA